MSRPSETIERYTAPEREYDGNGIAYTAGGHPFDVNTGEIVSNETAVRLASDNLSGDELVQMFDDPPQGRRIELVDLETVDIVPQKWLIYPFLPVGKVTVYAGYGGVGKTLFSLWQASQLTNGLTTMGDFKDKPVDVLYIGREDGVGPLKAHAAAAGVDLKRFHPVSVRDTISGHDVERGFKIPDDLDVLETFARDRDVKLVIIDPPESCIEGKLNDQRTVRRALDPLAAFAERCDVAVLLIGHMSTSGRLTGSEVFRDIVRSKVDFAKDQDAGDVVIELEKSQYSPEEGKCWSYRIDVANVINKFGDSQQEPRVNPVSFMETTRTAKELLARQVNKYWAEPRQSLTAAASEWLEDYLADGPKPAADVLRAAAEVGFTQSAISNARRRAKNPSITATPDPNHTGRGRSMIWQLEESQS